MEIQFNSPLQKHLADLIWNAESTQKVKDIISVYGVEAEVVFQMIMAEYWDTEMDTDLAEEVITRVK